MANEENLQPFKPGESGNPNGRPRKMVSQVISELEETGIEHVTKQQVQGAIETLLNLKHDELKKYAVDEEHSALIRIVARHLLKSGDDERVFRMISEMAFGKPDQHTEHSGTVAFESLDIADEKTIQTDE